MRPLVRAAAIAWLAAACSTAPRGAVVADADLAVTNVAVIDVERGRLIPSQTVLARDGRIVAVVRADGARVPASARTIDGSDKYLMPGLWDMHVHMSLSGKPAQIEMPLFIAHGVTGVRVMGADGVTAPTRLAAGLAMHRAWQQQVAAGRLLGPRLLALASWAVDGPARIPDSMPAYFKAVTREDGRQLARHFKERGFDFVKVYNNFPREGYLGLAEEARTLGLPFAGHEPSSLSALELSNAGQKSIEHSRIFLFNCWPGADSMRRGLLRASPTVRRQRMVAEYDAGMCGEVFRTFARNGTWITPTHLTRRMDAFAHDSAFRNDPRLKYVPRAQRQRWQDDAARMVAGDSSAAGRRSYMDFYRKGLELTNVAYRAGVRVMLGTDAGDSFVFPGASVHDELVELVSAGLSPAEALRAATLSGAEYLGLGADYGRVTPGRYADLVLLDANPLEDVRNTRRIRAVMLGGRVLERPALDSLLASAEAEARR
jgi:hypothetical protein